MEHTGGIVPAPDHAIRPLTIDHNQIMPRKCPVRGNEVFELDRPMVANVSRSANKREPRKAKSAGGAEGKNMLLLRDGAILCVIL